MEPNQQNPVNAANKTKVAWLITFLVLVVMTISIGGITRMTRSGLSIVEWKPIAGIIPPLSEMEWQSQFEMYTKTPEYQQINSHFELADYKKIFMWEYLHRVFGRILFLFVVLSGAWLYRKKIIEGRVVVLLSALIAVQGLIGWLMVKSGLNRDPHVSPYMLALHFFSALTLLTVTYYYLSKMRPTFEIRTTQISRVLFRVLGVVLALQIFYGCLTSGLKAGYAFNNTFPLMGDSFWPPSGFTLSPLWINLFENPITVQWLHRWLGITAWILTLVTGYSFIKGADGHRAKGPFIHLAGVTTSQALLGIGTLMMGLPIWLAAIHQIMATLVVLGYFNIVFRMKYVEA